MALTIPKPSQVARDFARDCARLLNVESADALERDERRQIAMRWALRTWIPALRDCPRKERRVVREVLDDVRAGRWPDQFPSLAYVIAALGRLHADLRQHVLPRIDSEYGFLVVGDGVPTETVVVARRGYAERLSIDGAVNRASPFEITASKEMPKVELPAFTKEQREKGRILDCPAGRPLSAREVSRNRNRSRQDALYSPETVLALQGTIMTLSQSPWSRCANELCQLVFAPGRKGALYCSSRCRGRAGYDDRRQRLAVNHLLERQAAKRASDAVMRIHQAKKNGTWQRQRRPGAGRPRKEKGG